MNRENCLQVLSEEKGFYVNSIPRQAYKYFKFYANFQNVSYLGEKMLIKDVVVKFSKTLN
jgi:hypothetical protein